MSVPTPALEPGKKPLESRRRYRDGQKLSISEQLNDPGSLWRTAHLPGPEPVKVATHPIAQSQSTGAQLSKAMDKGHSASEIGNPDGSRDVPSRYRRPQAEPSKTLSDFVASGGAKDAGGPKPQDRIIPPTCGKHTKRVFSTDRKHKKCRHAMDQGTISAHGESPTIVVGPADSQSSQTGDQYFCPFAGCKFAKDSGSHCFSKKYLLNKHINTHNRCRTVKDTPQVVANAPNRPCSGGVQTTDPGGIDLGTDLDAFLHGEYKRPPRDDYALLLASMSVILARLSGHSTTSSSRASRTSSIFSAPQAERSSAGSSMSSWSMKPVEPFPVVLEDDAEEAMMQFAQDYNVDEAPSKPENESIARFRQADKGRKSWGCGYCAAYLDNWEGACSHISNHVKSGSRHEDWKYTNVIRGLLRRPGLDRHWQNLLVQRHGSNPESHVVIRFEDPATGGSDFGLQNMLEFGPLELEFKAISQFAYDLGVKPHLKVMDPNDAGAECASRLSNLVLSEEAENCPVSPVECPADGVQVWKRKQDASTIHARKASVESKSQPGLKTRHVGSSMPKDSTSSTQPATNLDLTSPPEIPESVDDASSDSDTWSTSSVLTGDSSNLPDSEGFNAPSCHGGIPRNSHGSAKQILMLSRQAIQHRQPASSHVSNKKGIIECASPGDSASAASKHSFSHSSSSDSQSGLRKKGGSGGGSGRRRIGGEDNGDDGDDENNSLQGHDGEAPGTRKLACPYFKRNPSLYSGTKYRLCQYSGFASVHRLKEHLYRKHRLPLLCGRCNEKFISPADLQSHLKNKVICKPSFETPDVTEGFNSDQERELRKRKRSGVNEAGKWGEVYRILFPDDSGEIPSPFSTLDLTEDAKLREALKSEISSFVRDSYLELSRRVCQNLELNFLVEPSRLEEARQSGLLNLIVDQTHREMQGLIEEFLIRTRNPQSRTITPLGEVPVDMEEGGRVAPLFDIAGTGLLDELNLPADGFGPVESDRVAAHWLSDRLPDPTLPSPSTGEVTVWQDEEPQFGTHAAMESLMERFGTYEA